ncbi:MAG: methyltransferase domain-containing protein [Nitrospina sp.]|nr:methyltransferase domain-containing protein [Nitrospina sp.]
MGLGMSVIQNALELHQQGIFSNVNKVVEVGAQELYIEMADFEEMIDMAALSNYKRDNFPNLGNWPKRPRCSSKYFFQLLGIEEYYSLDLSKEQGSISHDYNLPFEDKALWSQFDLVTDYGACEHAFNVGEAYRTMHRLCKPGGLIIICQSLWKGNGYFLYDNDFFEGIAAANNYKILYSSYIVLTDTKTKNGSPLQFHIPVNKDLLDTIDLNKVAGIAVYAVFQKQEDADFQYPYQGHYLSQKQGNLGFNRLFYRDPPSYSYIPMSGKTSDVTGKFLLKLLFQKIKIRIYLLFSKIIDRR